LNEHLLQLIDFAGGGVDRVSQTSTIDALYQIESLNGLPGFIRLKMPDQMPSAIDRAFSGNLVLLCGRFLDIILAEISCACGDCGMYRLRRLPLADCKQCNITG